MGVLNRRQRSIVATPPSAVTMVLSLGILTPEAAIGRDTCKLLTTLTETVFVWKGKMATPTSVATHAQVFGTTILNTST